MSERIGNARVALQDAVAEVMSVESIDYNMQSEEAMMVIRGHLQMPAEDAFDHLRPKFEAQGYTPKLREENGMAAVYALHVVFEKQETNTLVPALLLIATIISVFVVGLGFADIYIGPIALLTLVFTGDLPANVNPALMPTDAQVRQALFDGFLYVLSLVGILGAHEMGHFLMAKRYQVDTTPPYFIPLPNILGTLGAVIAMREPSPNRRIQFDIGVAGPIAGLIVTIPVLFIGLALSDVRTRDEIRQQMPEAYTSQFEGTGGITIIQEGQSLMYLAAKFIVFGEILPSGDKDVWVHPMAFAGWAGLLVTALNLMPVGQLDGGHVIYGLFGEDAQKFRQPVLVVLFGMAIIGSLQGLAEMADPSTVPLPAGFLETFAELPLPVWSGWWLWAFLLLFMARNHAPVLNEITDLDQSRKLIGVATLIIFVLIFTPKPLEISSLPVGAMVVSSLGVQALLARLR